jgi:electron transfer flavoprotein beta subunit
LPLITYAVQIHEINPSEKYIVTERKTERWNEIIRTPLPSVLTCEKEIAEIPYASLPNLIHSLQYEPEIWSAEAPIKFAPDCIGLKGSPTTVFKTTQPEKHTAGQVIKVSEVGIEPAVRLAFEKINASGVLNAMTGGKT